MTSQADLVAIALARLASRQAANLVTIEAAVKAEPTPKAEKAPKSEKSGKAPKAAKSEKEPSHIPSRFMMAEALNLETFPLKVKEIERLAALAKKRPDPMALGLAAAGFVAWLKETASPWLATLSPAMAPGALLESCKLIVRTMNDPSWTVEEDHSNREGERFIFGSAGKNARAEKMFGHLTSLLLQAEHLKMEYDAKAVDASESARFADECEEFETAETLREECLVYQADALTETARAESIRAMIENLNVEKAEEMYERAGQGEIVEEVTIARGLLADEEMSAGGLHRVKMRAFIDAPVQFIPRESK
ncbi:MAG TPA: hypothetical protein PLE74_07500 [Candidatus Cloacimonadota bacterium]|nr:hypothetical protein [Candidatus Cloacimonadota bacterium]